jgi:hypothetical protein
MQLIKQVGRCVGNLAKRPSLYTLLLFGVLAIFMTKPAMIETYGMLGHVTERTGVQTATTVRQQMNSTDNEMYPVNTYHFTDAAGVYASSSDRVLQAHTKAGDTVRLGFVHGRLATVNGVFIFQLDFLVSIVLVATCVLPACGLYLWAKERQDPEEFVVNPAKALGIATLAALTALVPGLLGMAAVMYFEDQHYTWWPEALLALSCAIGLLAAWRISREPYDS